MKIKFKKLNKNAKLPTRGSEQAGAWDVYASEIIKESDGYYIVSLGFATEIPKGYRMMASGRSGLTKTNWYIPNTSAIIDADYRGDWQVRFRGVPIDVQPELYEFINGYGEEKTSYEFLADNIPSYLLVYDKFPFEVGDRVAQIYLEKVFDIEFEEVENLEDSIRGVGGFGSTGR